MRWRTDACALLSYKSQQLPFGAVDDAKAHRLFAALGDGGQVDTVIKKIFWTPLFGMVADRFAAMWVLSFQA